MLNARPVHHAAGALKREALPAVGVEHAVAHLGDAVRIGRAVEADMPDHAPVGQHHGARDPRPYGRIVHQVCAAKAEHLLRLRKPVLNWEAHVQLARGRREIAGEQRIDEREREQHELEAVAADQRRIDHPPSTARRAASSDAIDTLRVIGATKNRSPGPRNHLLRARRSPE